MQIPGGVRAGSWAGVAILLAIHVYFETAHCKHSSLETAEYLAIEAVMVLITVGPSLVMALVKFHWASLVTTIPIAAGMIWAYRIECVLPYSGGGAAMAFVPVIMFIVPASCVVGLIVQLGMRKRHAS